MKAILKVWLKDRKFASDIASSLMDLLKSKTADVIAQRRASRQFEEIGEKVAESLLPVFEMEGAHLDESSCTAVALAVAETLNKSSIDAELLAARDLDLTKLVGHLLASHPSATQDLSSAEAALYQRIISESSQYIIDIASQLPTFTERTIAEILKRESQLLAVTNQTLEEVRRIRAESQRVNPEVEAARFETEYRRAVVRKLDELELFGADVSAVSRRHRLSIAYVTLSVEQRTSGYREDLFPMHAKSSIRSKNADDEDGRNIVSAEDALAGSRYLLVRGLAGSGKTTLLQWMAVRSASQSFEGQLADWNNTVPFFIRLRQCVEAGLPAPEDWPRLVTPAITAIMPDHWVHHQLTSGRAIVLVDGVDELPQSQRSAVREWLKELVEAFHDARFIVSSRPHAVEEGWMEREGFDDAELQPMELADISAFIDHWHDAVREGIRDEEEKAELLSLAGHLKGVVQQNRPIRNLATSPLLCAMLCALHRDRRQQLPSDRIELYEAGCQMLLERRDSERRVELRDYPLVSYRQKRALLQDFAYWLLANGWSEVTQERADERIALRLRDMEGISRDATGADVHRLFVERSGLLREPIPGHIDFTHRTFQEFLAAQAALDEGDLGVLVKNAHDDQWQEVIVLAAGIASKRFREELIAALIARGDQESSRRHQLHLLAVACLETALELGLEVKAEVRKHLAALIPPKNMREAKALASAGELAVPFLVRKTPQRATFTAASVRTLALIGGEAALNTLEGYKHDTRQVVVAELVRAWDAFDRSDYASRVLSSICGRGHHLEVVGSSSLEGIQHLADLNSLALFRCSQVSDLSPLALLPNLTALTLIFCKKIKDLSPLRAITKLNSFKLWNCEAVDDLTPLAELTNLTSLGIGGVIPVSDLRPLASLLNLAELEIRVLEQVRDLSPLTGLPKLTRLKLWYLPQVGDLGVLISLPNLTRLALGNFPYLVSLDLLPQLSKLTDLSLAYLPRLRNLSPIAPLVHLTELSLTSLQQVSDLSPLASLVNLTSLELHNCEQVTDLSPLMGLTNLTHLSLNSLPHVRSLNPLAQLKNLQALWLARIPQGIKIPKGIKKRVRIYPW